MIFTLSFLVWNFFAFILNLHHTYLSKLLYLDRKNGRWNIVMRFGNKLILEGIVSNACKQQMDKNFCDEGESFADMTQSVEAGGKSFSAENQLPPVLCDYKV